MSAQLLEVVSWVSRPQDDIVYAWYVESGFGRVLGELHLAVLMGLRLARHLKLRSCLASRLGS